MSARTVELAIVTGLLLAGAHAVASCGSLYEDFYAPLTEAGGGDGGGGGGAGTGGCLTDECVSGGCNDDNDSTHVPEQIEGDCLVHVCENGQVVGQIDDADAPDDGDPCTTDTCAGGVPSYEAKTEGAACHDEHGAGTCNGGLCKHALGSPCSQAADCYPPACVDGVCCENACQGTCASCNNPGSAGECQLLPGGAEDLEGSTLCKDDSACVAGGVCEPLLSNGEPCANPGQCGSKSCVNGVCKLSNGSPCAADVECCSGSCVANECDGVDTLCDGNP